jgi:hypothetical protein
VPGPVTVADVDAFGDSVMRGAHEVCKAMRPVMPNIYVSAQGSRQLSSMASEIRARKADGRLAPIVVIHAGTNGTLNSAELNQLVNDLSDRRLVVLVTVKAYATPTARVNTNNSYIWAAASSHANVAVADWFSASKDHNEYFNDDQLTHLSGTGCIVYANVIAAKVRSAPPIPDPTPTPEPSPEPSTSPQPSVTPVSQGLHAIKGATRGP